MKLHNYQLEAVRHIIDTPKSGLFLGMGLGKTASTLTAVRQLILTLDVSRVLVIAPKRVVQSVWVQENEKWATGLQVVRVTGAVAQRITALKTKADIYVIGRDSVSWLAAHYGGVLPFDMLVIDESSSFKNHQSQRFKALKNTSFSRVVLLTGTPAPNSLIDLWPQIYLLDKGKRLGKTISAYRAAFFTPGKSRGDVVYKYDLKNESSNAEIHEAISDVCMSMSAKDYLDLPEKVTNLVYVDFEPSQLKEYKRFEREKITQFFGKNGEVAITATNAAALSNKLLQYANGCVYDEDKQTHVVHDLKIQALHEIVEAAQGKPVLLAWTYRSDADRIKQEMKKYKPVRLNSDSDVEDWNAGKTQLLMMHPASGGHGLNLQAGGSIIVWYGNTWSLELEQQFNARLDRQGQTQTVVVNKIVTRGTIDEDVINAQERKEVGQSALMESIKRIICKP